MDNIESSGLSGKENPDKYAPSSSDSGQMKVSHAPLNLGGSATPVMPRPPAPKPVAAKPMDSHVPVAAARVTCVKTFFTKLHAGAIEFLDEQINKWLQENPGVRIKMTNTTTGEIQGKKTEPHIIIHVWY